MRTGLVAGYGVLLVLTTGLVNLGGNMWGRIEQLQRLLPFENTIDLQGDIDMRAGENEKCEKLCHLINSGARQFADGKCDISGKIVCYATASFVPHK